MRFVIRHHGEVESTQEIARQLADEGAPEGTVVQASAQSAGRGRLGNSFYSPPGGLYVSVVLRPALAPAQAGVIGLVAGVAVAEGIQDTCGLETMLKWPNDLLLGGRKVCGLLVDLVSEGVRVRHAILGIGVNVNTGGDLFPAQLRASATSLSAELGAKVPLDELREAVLRRLDQRCGELRQAGPAPAIEAWRAWRNMLGQRVRTAAGDEGLAEDLDLDGALVVRLNSGEIRRVVAGEVRL